jgi:hypothetical protein
VSLFRPLEDGAEGPGHAGILEGLQPREAAVGAAAQLSGRPAMMTALMSECLVLPELGDGYTTAVTNFGFIANGVITTKEAIEAVQIG